MSRVNKTWRLPKPTILNKKKVWFPVVRIGYSVPFGYYEDPEDKDILIPIPEELELYELAKKHLKNYTYKDVAAWLTTRSGRKIGPSALHERINRERKNKRDLTNANYYAEKYKEACDKARKIEERIKRTTYTEVDASGS
tara:strand:- start:2980 stop:3399 length:420 start_codon:yes stop_codon:yes gene_type:complete